MNKLNEGPYQAGLAIPNCHESFEKYSEDLNTFIDLMAARRVDQIRFAFARYPTLIRDSSSNYQVTVMNSQNPNVYLCYMGAYLESLPSRYFEDDANIYDLDDDNPVHFVADERVENGDFRPYVTPSSSCSATSSAFQEFDYETQRSSEPIFKTISRWERLPVHSVLSTLVQDEIKTWEDSRLESVWLLDIPKRKLVEVTPVHLEISLQANEDYLQKTYHQSEPVEWNFNPMRVNE